MSSFSPTLELFIFWMYHEHNSPSCACDTSDRHKVASCRCSAHDHHHHHQYRRRYEPASHDDTHTIRQRGYAELLKEKVEQLLVRCDRHIGTIIQLVEEHVCTSRGTIERRRSALDTRASPHGGGRAGASGNVLVGIGLEDHTQRADNVEGRRSVLSGHLALLRVAVVGFFLGLLARGLERQLGLVEGRCSHCTFERSTSMSSRAHLAAATTAGGCGAARTMALVWAPTYRPRA